MAKDIFNREADKFGGAISADGCSLTFAGGSAGLLIQNMNIEYTQTITRLWEIGSTSTYYVATRPEGTFGMARVVGPRVLASDFFEKFGDVCNVDNNVFNLGGNVGCTTADKWNATYKLSVKNVVVNRARWEVTSQDMVLNQNLQGIFASMTTTEAGGRGVGPGNIV